MTGLMCFIAGSAMTIIGLYFYEKFNKGGKE
ncbi:hypothetical protein FUSNEC_GEN_300_09245 [Fusobacterium necrophorum subsp. funduliforme]